MKQRIFSIVCRITCLSQAWTIYHPITSQAYHRSKDSWFYLTFTSPVMMILSFVLYLALELKSSSHSTQYSDATKDTWIQSMEQPCCQMVVMSIQGQSHLVQHPNTRKKPKQKQRHQKVQNYPKEEFLQLAWVWLPMVFQKWSSKTYPDRLHILINHHLEGLKMNQTWLMPRKSHSTGNRCCISSNRCSRIWQNRNNK